MSGIAVENTVVKIDQGSTLKFDNLDALIEELEDAEDQILEHATAQLELEHHATLLKQKIRKIVRGSSK